MNPRSSAYEADEIDLTSLPRNIFDFHNSSTDRFYYVRNFWYPTATVVSPYFGRPGTSGELNEMREAKSSSLNLEALVTRTSLALHPLYPPTGRGPTSLW